MALTLRFPSFQEERLANDPHHQSRVKKDEQGRVHQDFVDSTKPDLSALKLQEAALRMELADEELLATDRTPSRGVVQNILSRFINRPTNRPDHNTPRAELQEKLQQNIVEQKMRSDILVMIHDHSVGELLDAQQVLQEDPGSIETSSYPDLPNFFLSYTESLNKNLPDKSSDLGKTLRTKAREMLTTLINQEIGHRLQEHLAPVIKAIDTALTESELKARLRDKYPFFSSHYERILRENDEPISPDSRLTTEQRTAANKKIVETMLAREIFPTPHNRPNAATERQAMPVAQLLLKRIEEKRNELSAKRAA